MTFGVTSGSARSTVAIYTDAGTSGALAIDTRPVSLEAIGALKRGDVLLVAKQDRISRGVIATAMIERLVTKRGARIILGAKVLRGCASFLPR